MKYFIASRTNRSKFFLLVICATIGCSGEPEIDPKALEYVSKASQVMVSPGRRDLKYPNAILYLDSAIARDKRCEVAYWNKIKILKGVKLYKDALLVADQLIALNPKAPNAILSKAILLKKLKDTSANAYFEKALHFYNLALKKHGKEQNALKDQYLISKSCCLYFLDGKKASFDQLMTLKRRLPDSKHIDVLISEVSNLSEAQFIEQL